MSLPRGRSQHSVRTTQTLAQRRKTAHFNERLVQNTRSKSIRRMNTQKRMTYHASSRQAQSLLPQGPTFQPIKLPDGTEVFKDEEELFEDVPSAPKKLALKNLRDQVEKAADIQRDHVDAKAIKAMLSDGKFKQRPAGAQVERSVFRGVLPEEPEQKYQNLRREIQQFATDLEQYAAESKSSEDTEFANTMRQALQFADTHLEQTHQRSDYQPYFQRGAFGKHAWVNRPLQSCVNNIREAAERTPLQDDNGRLTYKLYQRQGGIAPGSFDKQFADCEKRLTKIEESLGFIHNMEYPYPDLIRAYTFLQSRFDRIVAGQRYNLAGPQVRLVKEELRRIGHWMMQAEQRKPIKPEYQERRQEWYKIDDLYTIMSEHDILVFQLVHVIERLQCLKRLHERTYEAVERTNKLYSQQEALLESVQTDNTVLKTLLETMEANSTQLRNNFNNLEYRQTVLEKTANSL